MTTITAADLERLGFEHYMTFGWRKRSPNRTLCIAVCGGTRTVWIEQARAVRTGLVSLDHIKTAEQLEALVAAVLGGAE